MLWGGGPSGVAKEAPERHKVTGSSNVKVASNLSDPPAVPQEAMTGLELGNDEAEDNQKDEQISETPEQKPQGLKEKSSDALAVTLTKALRDAQTSKRSVQEWCDLVQGLFERVHVKPVTARAFLPPAIQRLPQLTRVEQEKLLDLFEVVVLRQHKPWTEWRRHVKRLNVSVYASQQSLEFALNKLLGKMSVPAATHEAPILTQWTQKVMRSDATHEGVKASAQVAAFVFNSSMSMYSSETKERLRSLCELQAQVEGRLVMDHRDETRVHVGFHSTKRLLETFLIGAQRRGYTGDNLLWSMLAVVKAISYDATKHELNFHFFSPGTSPDAIKTLVPFRLFGRSILWKTSTPRSQKWKGMFGSSSKRKAKADGVQYRSMRTFLLITRAQWTWGSCMHFAKQNYQYPLRLRTSTVEPPHSTTSTAWELLFALEGCSRVLKDISRIIWLDVHINVQHPAMRGSQKSPRRGKRGHQMRASRMTDKGRRGPESLAASEGVILSLKVSPPTFTSLEELRTAITLYQRNTGKEPEAHSANAKDTVQDSHTAANQDKRKPPGGRTIMEEVKLVLETTTESTSRSGKEKGPSAAPGSKDQPLELKSDDETDVVEDKEQERQRARQEIQADNASLMVVAVAATTQVAAV
ncbi:hypothetical protein GQ600_10713 [Phytophthora cactorum]|nr:hypothetical protein GQ600_10713 [Phytophthora cactorum]